MRRSLRRPEFTEFTDPSLQHFWVKAEKGSSEVNVIDGLLYRKVWSIGCEDIKIFRFFKMAAAAILDFRNREFLFADGI